MRVIAGYLGGRQFDSPKSYKTHPMSEKMRGALFNVLGDIEGLTVFDAYGGSGALAYEAISRGAKSALICEIDKDAVDTITKNVKHLGISQGVKVIKQNCAEWVKQNLASQFDLVFCDPPYDDIKASQIFNLTQTVKTCGLLVLSLPADYKRLEFNDLILELDKKYGDGSLVYYRKKL